MIVEEIKYLYHDKDTESHQNQLHDRVHGPVVVFHQKKRRKTKTNVRVRFPALMQLTPQMYWIELRAITPE